MHSGVALDAMIVYVRSEVFSPYAIGGSEALRRMKRLAVLTTNAKHGVACFVE